MLGLPLSCALLALLCAQLVQSHRRHQSLYTIVRVPDLGSLDNTFIVLRGRKARLISDNRTVVALGYTPDSLAAITKDEFALLEVGPPMPLIHKEGNNPDEAVRVELLKNKELQGFLLHNLTTFGHYINPGVALFHGRYLAVMGLGWTLPGMNEGKPPDELLYHRWVNFSMAPYSRKDDYLGVNERIQRLQPTEVRMVGQDPRVVVVQENGEQVLHVSFTNRFANPIRVGKAVLVVDRATDTIRAREYLPHIEVPSRQGHKNWMPFVYNESRVLYISFVNPMTVMEVGDLRLDSTVADLKILEASGLLVSEVASAKLDWHHGELRGGTNAVFLPEHNVYVALFHSSCYLDGSFMTTYLMGAMTFSPHPPFKLLRISPLPLMDEALYTGPWHQFRNRHIDFVSFPTSLFRDPQDPTLLGLVFGQQDEHSVLAKLRIQELLDSLVPVGYE